MLNILIVDCLQVKLNNAVKDLKSNLVNKSADSFKTRSWRFRNFLPNQKNFGSGVLSIAPGTFMVGHKVSLMNQYGLPLRKC